MVLMYCIDTTLGRVLLMPLNFSDSSTLRQNLFYGVYHHLLKLEKKNAVTKYKQVQNC